MTMISKYKWPILATIALNFIALYISAEFGLYYRISYLDKVFHALGGVIAAWFFLVYFSKKAKSTSLAKLILKVAVFVYFVGVIWEFLEYTSAVYSPLYAPWLYHYFSIGSLLDSVGDLVADVSGGLVVLFIYLANRKR